MEAKAHTGERCNTDIGCRDVGRFELIYLCYNHHKAARTRGVGIFRDGRYLEVAPMDVIALADGRTARRRDRKRKRSASIVVGDGNNAIIVNGDLYIGDAAMLALLK